MTLRVDINIRGRMASDVGFITRAWMTASRHCQPHRGIDAEVFNHHQHRLIERAWRNERVTWLVGCWPDDVNFDYGFLCGEATDAGPVIHWVYVREHMRRFGIATALVEDFLRGQDRTRGFVTHDAAGGRVLFRRGGPLGDYIYNPYLWWEPTAAAP